jgi:hypothetical protein
MPLVSGVAVVGFAAYALYLQPLFALGIERRESVRLLKSAGTLDDLRAQLAHGALIEPIDGGWIAIRYRDPHAFHCGNAPHDTSESVAIAYDSDGRWFECKGNFCRNFAFISRELENHRRSVGQSNEARVLNSAPALRAWDELTQLFTATDLDAARRQLLAIGFHEFYP